MIAYDNAYTILDWLESFTKLCFMVWMETCQCYLSLFERPHVFLLISYQLFACTIFLMWLSLLCSVTPQTSKKSRSWTGRKSGEPSCIAWGTGWTHLKNEAFNLFLGCLPMWISLVSQHATVAVWESHCLVPCLKSHSL